VSTQITPKHSLPLVDGTQASQEVPHNTAVVSLDQLVNLAVSNIATPTNAPPGSPADGDAYLLGASPTGVWSGFANKIAYYYAGWKFFTAKEGMRAYDKNNDKLYTYDGAAWNQVASASGVGNVTFQDGVLSTSVGLTAIVSDTGFTSGQTNQVLFEMLIAGGTVGTMGSYGMRRMYVHGVYSGTTWTFTTLENVVTGTSPGTMTWTQSGNGWQIGYSPVSGTQRIRWALRTVKDTNGAV
jgi:hypothetical protein